ncbi:2-hydroxyacid dehydrogenase [Spirillospora sp. NPDC000708]
MIALVPADARIEAMGPLPDGVELAVFGDSVPEGAEFCVLDPPARDRFAEILPRLTALKVVQTLSAGVDRVPKLPDGVTLCNASGVHDGPVAEWIVAAILAMNKDLPRYMERQSAGQWDTSGNTAFSGAEGARDLSEQHVLIVGHGSIGQALQWRLAPFGTRVTGIARHRRDGVHGPEDLPGLLPDADVVVLLAPATDETRGMVDAAFLARMRPGALLVNAARGTLVQTSALLEALREGRVRAALDTTDPEPLPPGHPLFSAPGVLVTPHVAGSSAHWRDRAYRLAGDQLRRYAAGEPLVNVRRHGY